MENRLLGKGDHQTRLCLRFWRRSGAVSAAVMERMAKADRKDSDLWKTGRTDSEGRRKEAGKWPKAGKKAAGNRRKNSQKNTSVKNCLEGFENGWIAGRIDRNYEKISKTVTIQADWIAAVFWNYSERRRGFGTVFKPGQNSPQARLPGGTGQADRLLSGDRRSCPAAGFNSGPVQLRAGISFLPFCGRSRPVLDDQRLLPVFPPLWPGFAKRDCTDPDSFAFSQSCRPFDQSAPFARLCSQRYGGGIVRLFPLAKWSRGHGASVVSVCQPAGHCPVPAF